MIFKRKFIGFRDVNSKSDFYTGFFAFKCQPGTALFFTLYQHFFVGVLSLNFMPRINGKDDKKPIFRK